MECTKSTKINVSDYMNCISAPRDAIKPDVIKNCFRKGKFGVWNDLEQTKSSSLKDEDFQSLQNFVDYTTTEDDRSIRILYGMIADAMTVETAQKEDDRQEEEDESISTATVAVVLHYVSELRKGYPLRKMLLKYWTMSTKLIISFL